MISSSDILQSKVLIVDDQESNILLLDRMLRGAGYGSIASTTVPGEVSALHLKNHYDLILLDLQMPGMDGFEVMEALKEIEPDGYLPVLVITAQPGHKLRALQAGAKDFIRKPFELADVLARVHNMIEVRLLYEELHRYNNELEQRVRERTVDIEESEAKFRRLVEHLLSVVYIKAVGDEATTPYVSPQIESLLGYSPQEWLADPNLWSNSLHPHDRQSVLAQTDDNDSCNESFDIEYRMITRDGSLVWVRDQATLVDDPKGRHKFRQGIMVDITERKHAEERIKRQLEHLTALRNIDRVIAGNFDLQLSLFEILTHVTIELGVDAADILILNPHSQMLEYGAERGYRTQAIKKTQVRLGETYAGRAALERQLVQISNIKNEPDDLYMTTLLAGEDFVCYFGVPLIAKGQVKGVLEVFHRSPLEPDAEWFDFLHALAGQTAIAIESSMLFESLQRSNLELTLAYDATIEGWSRALDLRDKETEGHTQRVTTMTLKLARVFGLNESELVQVRWGALLHDIGKMGVPDRILLKPGPLTADEWIAMKKHPVFAYEMLSPIRYLRLALDIPYSHHEKWDGTGYPRGLKGTQIPLIARIFAVVDVWDALTSMRPYRGAWSEEKVREHIDSLAGTHFDPHVVDVFLQKSSSIASPLIYQYDPVDLSK